MSSPPSKSYASATQSRSSYGNPGRQSSWDSVHALTEGMGKMNVRGSTPSKAHNRRSSSSSTSSTPIVTPVPSKDADSSQSPYPQSGTPSHFQSPHVASQSPHPSAYQYRSPNGGKDEVLQVNYELQPRHLLPGMSPNNKGTNGSGPTFSPQGVNAYGQQAGVGVGGDNKAPQDIAAQIALSTIQGLNTPQPVQPQGTGQSQMNGAPAQPPPLNQAALAAAAAYNPALMQGLYGNGLYNPALGAQAQANALNGGAVPFYPQQVQPDVAQAVANAMAQLPSGALHAALQGMGVGTYPLNPALNPALNPQLAAAAAAAASNPALMQQMQQMQLSGMGPMVGMPGMGVQGLVMPGVGLGVGGVPGSVPGQPGVAGMGVQGGPSANNRKLSLYKTELCRSWEEKGTCRYGPKCQFAHGEDELKRVQRHPKYKTEICRTFWLSGSCPYGKRCCFIHTELPIGGDGEKKEGEVSTPSAQAQNQRSWEKDSVPSDSEQQQTSMLARIRRDPSASTQGNTPSPQPAHQGVNGHGAIGSSISPAVSSPGIAGRPALGALRVDTKTLNEATVPKASYPFTSNPAMPAPGMSMQSEVVRGRLSPVPATAGADFGRHAAARMEVVGISPHDQSQSVTPQASNPPGRLGSHMRSVSQTFTSGMSSAIEPSGGRISPIGGERAQHGRAESWGANTLIGPASAVEGRGRKW